MLKNELINNSIISVVLPAFNEEGNIVVIANKLAEVLNEYNYEVLFVDDGSTDKTVEIIKDISTKKQKY